MPDKHKYEITALSRVTLQHTAGETTSKAEKVDLKLETKGLDNSVYFDEKDMPTAEGAKLLTTALVMGMTNNIHMAHQEGFWDSAAHLRYIIEKVTEGFALPLTTVAGDWKPQPPPDPNNPFNQKIEFVEDVTDYTPPHFVAEVKKHTPPGHPFDPILKIAMEEIKAVFKKYDIAGCMELASANYGEFYLEISPSWSGMRIGKGPDGSAIMHMRAREADYAGGKEARNQVLEATAGMLDCLGNGLAQNFLKVDKMRKAFEAGQEKAAEKHKNKK